MHGIRPTGHRAEILLPLPACRQERLLHDGESLQPADESAELYS